jgi:hypothetical protein
MLPVLYDIASQRFFASSSAFQSSMRSCKDASLLVN